MSIQTRVENHLSYCFRTTAVDVSRTIALMLLEVFSNIVQGGDNFPNCVECISAPLLDRSRRLIQLLVCKSENVVGVFRFCIGCPISLGVPIELLEILSKIALVEMYDGGAKLVRQIQDFSVLSNLNLVSDRIVLIGALPVHAWNWRRCIDITLRKPPAKVIAALQRDDIVRKHALLIQFDDLSYRLTGDRVYREGNRLTVPLD